MSDGRVIHTNARFQLTLSRTSDSVEHAADGWVVQIQCGFKDCKEIPMNGEQSAFVPVRELTDDGIAFAFSEAIVTAMDHITLHAIEKILSN